MESFALTYRNARSAGITFTAGISRSTMMSKSGTSPDLARERGPRNLHEREAAFLAEAAESLAGRKNALRGNGDDALTFQNVHDGGGIQSAGAAKKNGALQYAYVFHCVEAIFAGRALWNDEAERLPRAERRGRNADAASDFADPQKRLRVGNFRC